MCATISRRAAAISSPRSNSERDGRMWSFELGGVSETVGPFVGGGMARSKEPGESEDSGRMHSDRKAGTDFEVA